MQIRSKGLSPTFRTRIASARWTIPVLVVSQKPRYFTDIKNELVSITDRALSQSLKQLQAQHWLQRKIDPAIRPPRPLYQAANVGARISRAFSLEAL